MDSQTANATTEHLLAVTQSVDNRKLKLRTIPPVEVMHAHVIKSELCSVVEGVSGVRILARGVIVVEFNTHRQAALARRFLVPGNVVIGGKYEVKQVDWADPEVGQPSPENDRSGRVLSVGNINSRVMDSELRMLFNWLSGGKVMDVLPLTSKGVVLVSFKFCRSCHECLSKTPSSRCWISTVRNHMVGSEKGGSRVLQLGS